MKSVWSQIIELKSKDTRHVGVANNLKDDELETIIATIDFFGASDSDMKQAYWDLKIARYRVFDWLGMAVMGRVDCIPAVRVLAYSFLKVNGNVDEFIDDLRVTDYECDESWKSIKLEAIK